MTKSDTSFYCTKCQHIINPMRIDSGKYIKPCYCENCGADSSQMRARIHVCTVLVCEEEDVDGPVVTSDVVEHGCELVRELLTMQLK